MILRFLVDQLGQDVLGHLLQTRTIEFCRFSTWFGYQGGGGGLILFEACDGPGQRRVSDPDLGTAYHADLEAAVDTAIRDMNLDEGQPSARPFKQLILESTIEVPTTEAYLKFDEETFADIRATPVVMDFLKAGGDDIALNRLPGLAANKIQVFHPLVDPGPTESPLIRAVLRVAFENLLLNIHRHARTGEVSASTSTLQVLSAKGRRLGLEQDLLQDFEKMHEVYGVPDIGDLFAAGLLSASQLVELRESREARGLRSWLGGAQRRGKDSAVTQFLHAVADRGPYEKPPVRALRFAGTSLLSALGGGVVGTAATALDTFLLAGWFQQNSPRLFFDRVRQLDKSAHELRGRTPTTGRFRNSRCPCGSGAKFKKCCGR